MNKIQVIFAFVILLSSVHFSAIAGCKKDEVSLVSKTGYQRCISIKNDWVHIQFGGSDFTAAKGANDGDGWHRQGALFELMLTNRFSSPLNCLLSYEFHDKNGRLHQDSIKLVLDPSTTTTKSFVYNNFYDNRAISNDDIDFVRGLFISENSICHEINL